MAKSLFTVTVIAGSAPVVKNVLSCPATSPVKSALQVAIDAALTAAGPSAVLNSAQLQGGRPIDVIITPAVSPATDGTPVTLFQVQFSAGGSGPLLVLSNPQTTSGVTASAPDLAIAAAVTAAGSGAVPSNINMLANVDIEA